MIIVRSTRPRRSTKCVFEVGIAWIVAKRATEKKHEVRIRGWHCVYLSAPFGRHCAVKYKKLKFPIDFLKAISYDMPNK